MKIPDLFLVLNMISHSFAALTREISCSTLEINLVFPRTHVLFSIYYIDIGVLPETKTLVFPCTSIQYMSPHYKLQQQETQIDQRLVIFKKVDPLYSKLLGDHQRHLIALP